MKHEIYEDGILIETREIEGIFFAPNYSNFNTEIFFSQGYLKITQATRGMEVKATLDLLATRLELKREVTGEDLEVFKVVWDGLIALIPEGVLSTEDNEDFNIKAESNFMPFRFHPDFKLNLIINNEEITANS